MAELKTKKTGESVTAFIEKIADEERRKDFLAILSIMKRITRKQPKMWGASIVGLGDYRYKYASGREGDWFQVGLAPRKQEITLYLVPNLTGREALLAKLGKHKAGGSCLHVKRLADVDIRVLEKLIAVSVRDLQRMKG